MIIEMKHKLFTGGKRLVGKVDIPKKQAMELIKSGHAEKVKDNVKNSNRKASK